MLGRMAFQALQFDIEEQFVAVTAAFQGAARLAELWPEVHSRRARARSPEPEPRPRRAQ
jgi:hypothetical protein